MKRPPLITILDRYIFVQLALTVLFALVLFSIIWLAPDIVFKLIQYTFAGDITPAQAAVMFAYHLPAVLQQTIPMATLLGSIFLFQRLSQSYELIAILASGITRTRVLQAVLWVGLVFGALHCMVQEVIAPWSGPRLEKMYRALDLKDAPDRNFVFVEKNHQGKLDKFFMIGQVGETRLSDFILLYYGESPDGSVRISRILRAKTGNWQPETRHWQLAKGIEYVLNEEGVYQEIRPFDTQFVRTDRYAAKLLEYSRTNPMTLGWKRLDQYITLLREGGQLQEVPYFEVRLLQKLTAPLMSMLFILLGALLGMEQVRSNRSYGLTFGALVIFVYSVLVPFSGNLSSLGVLPAWLVAVLPLGLTALLGALLLRWRPGQA